jgi:hypothetical protein
MRIVTSAAVLPDRLLECCPICLLQGGDVSVDSVPRGALGIRELTHYCQKGVVTIDSLSSSL